MLSGCASIDVDTTAANFNEEKYAEDLGTCRGETAEEATLSGLGITAVGSFWGAAEGASYGRLAGATGDGAIIGAIVGSVIGVLVAANKPNEGQEQSVRSCLRGKGYTVSS